MFIEDGNVTYLQGRNEIVNYSKLGFLAGVFMVLVQVQKRSYKLKEVDELQKYLQNPVGLSDEKVLQMLHPLPHSACS